MGCINKVYSILYIYIMWRRVLILNSSGSNIEFLCPQGRSMALSAFYRVARNTMSMYFKPDSSSTSGDPASLPSPAEVEAEFWNHVTSRMLHICVHSGSIDTGSNGCGFPTNKNATFAKHPWNLKVLTNNPASILRSLNSLVGM